LTLEGMRWELGEGAMGLATWKLVARFGARLPVKTATGTLDYRDDLRPEEVGWKEVMLTAGGSSGIARANVPSHDRSYELTDYAAISELPNRTRSRPGRCCGSPPHRPLTAAPDARQRCRREPSRPRARRPGSSSA
jgi:hypothetical protein